MNALTTIPADLLAEAFKCSGSVTPDSAPWKSQAIAALEARLALALRVECNAYIEPPRVPVQNKGSKASVAARAVSRAENVAMIGALRAQGKSLGQIEEALGLSHSYTARLLREVGK